jgi:hypothetical protein
MLGAKDSPSTITGKAENPIQILSTQLYNKHPNLQEKPNSTLPEGLPNSDSDQD